MKKTFLIFLIIFSGLSCFGQEIEFCGSLNTSSEQRFQSSEGIGLQYQHDIGNKFKLGVGVHYNFNNSRFDYIPYIDADPNLIVTEKINSDSYRFAIRVNIQRLLKNNENVSISLGPEISYNYLWGHDQINERSGQSSNSFTQSNTLTKDLGIGLISKIEVKKILIPQLSMCFTVRPELMIGKVYQLIGGSPPVFSGVLGFTEFQIGLKYRFKK